MTPRSWWASVGAWVLMTGTSAALFQFALAAVPEEPQAPAPMPSAKTVELGGADRYLTFVSTDKPMYKPGETLYVRAAVLHHLTRQPAADGTVGQSQVEVIGPKGDTVASGSVPAQEGVIGFSWAIPATQSGGEYKVKVSHPWAGYAPAERKFDVRAYRAPRLKSQIKFLRDGYGPGEEVTATLTTERAEGGIPAGAKVTVIARVDGDEAYRGEAAIDAQGKLTARFPLPADIRRGEGTLALVIEDGGVVETASKTIPILLQTVDLTIYPEGGELVGGLPNRVYFEAFTPAKKPADLAGEIVDAAGAVQCQFRSAHEGRGRFEFTPKAGEKYTLKITEPAGIKTTYALPEVQATGAVIQSANEVFAANESVSLRIGGPVGGGELKVVVSKRELELASEKVAADGTLKEVRLAAQGEGVLVVTVFDAAGKPLAERLIYRQTANPVKVALSAHQPQYSPGGKAKVTIKTTDAAGKPVSAVVGVTVTDDSVLEMVDKREQAPRLPVMVFLEGEVKELADAHVYLDPTNKDAPQAVDLLLGTQGWRRFAVVDTAKFLAEGGDAARRVLALQLRSRREVDELRAEFLAVPRVAAFEGGPPGAPVPAALPQAAAPQAAPEVAAAPAPVPEDKPAPADEPAQLADRPNADFDAAAGAKAPPPLIEEQGERKQLQDALEKADAAAAEREIGGRRDLRAKRMANAGGPGDFVVVRVYAHAVRSNRLPNERVDFTETLFWHAGLKTDAATGEATVEFGMNDSVTSFRVAADAFTASGAIGEGTLTIDSVEPFYLEPKLPLEVTSGDHIRVPIGIVNATPGELAGVKLQIATAAGPSEHASQTSFDLAPGARVRSLHSIRVGKFFGEVDVTYSAGSGPYSDKVTRKLVVRPLGFPVEFGKGGMLPSDGTVTHEVEIPAEVVAGSVATRFNVYPTPLASLDSALERLIQEPCGCFEQTSSSVYPLVMAQQYFKSHTGIDPSLIQRSEEILARGYDRLIGFECKGGGYEWFGSDPGHDALTAYGLMEFTDMAKVREVDSAMLARTRKWMMEQRDGKGGFARKTHTLHTWLAEPEIANAYNTWALLETGAKDELQVEAAWVAKAAEATENTYVMALGAIVSQTGGQNDATARLLDRLAGKQQADGSLAGATTSVVGSGGEALTIETTALALLAWLPNKSYAEQVEKARTYLAESCKAGRFGSTQSTILALKAIVAYDQSRAKPKAPGSLQLVVDGQPVGEPIPFTTETQGAIQLPAFADKLTPGKHKVQVTMADGSEMPYSLAVTYHTVKPNSSEACKLHLETKLRDVKIDEGAVTEVQVAVVNKTGEQLPTPVAIIGIPGGLEVRHDQLKELVKQGKIAAYEVRGRDLVLYWRTLDKEQRVELPVSCIAAVPGTYTGPASRTYLYYTDEHKQWLDGLQVEISPK